MLAAYEMSVADQWSLPQDYCLSSFLIPDYFAQQSPISRFAIANIGVPAASAPRPEQ
jgi:hypothetical protein